MAARKTIVYLVGYLAIGWLVEAKGRAWEELRLIRCSRVSCSIFVS